MVIYLLSLKDKVFLTALFQEIINEQNRSLSESSLVSHFLAPEKLKKKEWYSVIVSEITRRSL